MVDTLSLTCLGGLPPPDELAADLLCILRLPEAARARIWAVLGPSVTGPHGDLLDLRIADFVRAHAAAPEELARALRGAGLLLAEASRQDAQSYQLAADLILLLGEDEGAALYQVLAPGYETLKQLLREEALRRTLADHGPQLVGVKWRVDRIVASEHAENLNAPVALLTLSLRDGSAVKDLTVHATVDRLRELLRVCEKLLS